MADNSDDNYEDVLSVIDEILTSNSKPFQYSIFDDNTLKADSLKAYNRYIKQFEKFIKKNTQFDPWNPTIEMMKAFVEYLLEEKYSTTMLWQFHSAIVKLYGQLNISIDQRVPKDLLKQHINGKIRMDPHQAKSAEDIPLETLIGVLLDYPEEGQKLMMKAWFVFCAVNCKRCDDAVKLQFEHLSIKSNCIDFNIIPLKKEDQKQNTKTGTCNGCIVDCNEKDISPFRIFLKYINSIPEKERTGRVFRHWVEPKKKDKKGYFSSKKCVGVNDMYSYMGRILEDVVSWCPMDVQYEYFNKTMAPPSIRTNKESTTIGFARYSGHSARKTAGTIIAQISTMNDMERQRMGNWKNANTVERYFNNNPYTRQKTSEKVSDFLAENLKRIRPDSTTTELQQEAPQEKKRFENCTFNNCTINF